MRRSTILLVTVAGAVAFSLVGTVGGLVLSMGIRGESAGEAVMLLLAFGAVAGGAAGGLLVFVLLLLLRVWHARRKASSA